MNRSMPGLPVHHQLLEFTQIHVHWVGDDIQPSHPLSSPSPSAPNPPQHQSFSTESTLRMRWPKYWSFSFSISPSNEHPGLVSFRMYWLDLLAVQGTLKSLLQHHISNASILRCSAFFTVQLKGPSNSARFDFLLGCWRGDGCCPGLGWNKWYEEGVFLFWRGFCTYLDQRWSRNLPVRVSTCVHSIEFVTVLLLCYVLAFSRPQMLVPRPGIKPMLPALEGRVLTTATSRKSLLSLFLMK